MHRHSKLIDVRFHFLHDLTIDRVVELVNFGTQEQVVDIMIKPLKLDVFLRLHKLLGVCDTRSKMNAICNQFKARIFGVVRISAYSIRIISFKIQLIIPID